MDMYTYVRTSVRTYVPTCVRTYIGYVMIYTCLNMVNDVLCMYTELYATVVRFHADFKGAPVKIRLGTEQIWMGPQPDLLKHYLQLK